LRTLGEAVAPSGAASAAREKPLEPGGRVLTPSSRAPVCGPCENDEDGSGQAPDWRGVRLGAQTRCCPLLFGPRPHLPFKVLGFHPFANMERPVNKRRGGGGPGGLALRRTRRLGPAPVGAPTVVISSDEGEAEAASRGEADELRAAVATRLAETMLLVASEEARKEAEEARKAAELVYRRAGEDLALDRRRVEAAAAQRGEEARTADEGAKADEAREAVGAEEAAEVWAPTPGTAAAQTGSGAQSSSWRGPDPVGALPRYGGIPVVQLGMVGEALGEEAGEEETQSDPDTAVDEVRAATRRPLRWRPAPCHACGVQVLAPAVPCWCTACTPAASAEAALACGGGRSRATQWR